MIAASIYMVLARVICMVGGESRSLVHPRLFNKIFGGVDVLCLLMISVGGVIGMDPRNTVGTKVCTTLSFLLLLSREFLSGWMLMRA